MAENQTPSQWNDVTKGEGLWVQDLKLPYGRLIRVRTWDGNPAFEQILFYPFAVKTLR
jgi:hypothetical protein